MRQELQQYAVNAVSSPKVAASVAVGSMGTGVGAYLEYITPVIGFFAAIAGLLLSITLIITKVISAYQEFKLNSLKIKDFEDNH